MLLGIVLATTPEAPPHAAPVTPGTTREARRLLDTIYRAYGRVTLSGQHNQMFHMSQPSERVERIAGRYPVVWGGEWGFSDARNDIDDVKYRPRLLDEIRAQRRAGRIVCVTYHQASPTVGEPCDFKGGVQIRIADAEWDAILTEGTPLHRVWAAEVDRLAVAFQTLQRERIPVVFRPYHEMNGGFWWSGHPERFQRLWAMLYGRYVHKFGLRNLLWAWTPDKPYPGVEAYFPGLDKVDLLGTDIYPDPNRKETYPQEWYDRMKALAGDKPLALSEMSVLPTDDELARQPWAWFMAWDGMVFDANTPERIKAAYASPRVSSAPTRG